MDLLNNGVVFRGPEDITSKDFTSHLAKWDKQDDGLISKMLCCPFCGQCELGGEVVSKTNGFAAIPPPPWANGAAQQMPPYSLSYPHLKDHMQTPDGKMWYRCSRCKEEDLRPPVALASLIAINEQVSRFEWSASKDTALYVEARRMQQNP